MSIHLTTGLLTVDDLWSKIGELSPLSEQGLALDILTAVTPTSKAAKRWISGRTWHSLNH